VRNVRDLGAFRARTAVSADLVGSQNWPKAGGILSAQSGFPCLSDVDSRDRFACWREWGRRGGRLLRRVPFKVSQRRRGSGYDRLPPEALTGLTAALSRIKEVQPLNSSTMFHELLDQFGVIAGERRFGRRQSSSELRIISGAAGQFNTCCSPAKDFGTWLFTCQGTSEGLPTVTGDLVPVAGVEIELFQVGNGAPIFFLHGLHGFSPGDPYVERLAERRKVIAPSHPGFGRSSLPFWIDSMDDLAHIHLALMDQLDLREVDVVGCSIGGWIASEMATKAPDRFKKIVLISPVGVKVGPADKLDVPDIFAMPRDKLNRLMFHDPERAEVDLSRLSDEDVAITVRNWETLALLSWEPYMHNPKLTHRLHRVTAPTLLLRGDSDGFVSQDYLSCYAQLLPNARLEVIPEAGHAPQLEQPDAFAAKVLAFVDA
jgi:pimeloyl-ACP methyl ester carboxylesterase